MPYAVYGVSEPRPVRSLVEAAGSKPIAYFAASGRQLSDEMHRVMGVALEGIPTEQVHVLSDPDDVLTLCSQNLQGVSTCYGAIEWQEVDTDAGLYNYTLRGNAGMQHIRVDTGESDADVYILPLQWAMDRAIANLTGTPESMPYTAQTEDDFEAKANRTYMKAIYNWIAPALYLTMIGVVYHLTGVVAQERELGLSALMASMGVSRFSRMLAYHVSFSAVYLLGWIIIALSLSLILYTDTNAAAIIFFHIFSGLAQVSFSIFVGCLFRRAVLAGIIASGVSVFLAICVTLQTRLPETGPYKPAAVYVLSVLFPPCNYTYFIATMSRWQWYSYAMNMVEDAPGSSIKTIGIFVAAIVQIFLFFGLAIAVDRYLYGIAPPDATTGGAGDDTSLHIGALTKVYKIGRWYQKLFLPAKKQPTFTAVNGISLDVAHGEIVCLLGANGSGKTTTLEMITGVQRKTNGTIAVRAGSKLGLCPQKNVLWDKLTVEEHMEIWAGLKGVPPADAVHTAIELADRCDLTLKANTLAVNLSGGQQRKLQLAIMFVGGSNLCCIDEASSGLDPVSRRKIWDILMANRGRVTIILTTHFLDEADILGDRIVIMSKGHVKADGPSVQLKAEMGSGYRVFHGKQGDANAGALVLSSAKEVVESVEHFEQTGTPFRIMCPDLEDVFLNVARDDHLGYRTDGKFSADEDAERIAEELRVESRGTVGTGKQIAAMLRKRLIIFRRTPYAELVAFILPIIVAIAARTFVKNYSVTDCGNASRYSNRIYSSVFWFDYLNPLVGPEAVFDESANGFQTFASNMAAQVGANVSQVASYVASNMSFVNNIQAFQDYIVANHTSVMPGGVYVNGNSSMLAYRLDEDDYGTYAGPIMFNLLNNLRLNGTTNIATSYSPFQTSWRSDSGDSLQFVCYWGLSVAVAPSFFALYPTYERLSKVRAMQYSNGLRVFPLWFAYILHSFIPWVLASAVCIGIISSANSDLIGMGYLFLCMILYGLAATLQNFVISFFVKSQLAAFAITAAVHAIYFLVYLIAYMSILAYSSAENIPTNLLLVFFFMGFFGPMANFIRALFVALNLFGVVCHTDGPGKISYNGDILAYGGPILYLCIQIAVLFAVLLLYDLGIFDEWWARFKHWRTKRKSPDPESSSDSLDPFDDTAESPGMGLEEETTKVDTTSIYDAGLKISHLSKSYGRNRVVDNVSFGVQENDTFALLGPNGAGKTTTFNMIRGEVIPDSGKILVNGISVTEHRGRARTRLGVCPQFDAMDKMAVYEILRFYGRLRGLLDVDEHVEKVIEAVGLAKFRDRMAWKLSGGNKRKLSLAIALIGNPSVLLLDEPSSGMDAFAKRIMWQTLMTVAHCRSIVITTHSMEEADALANKAGFLARKMLAVGDTDALRDSYGHVFHVHAICTSAPATTDAEVKRVLAMIYDQYPGTKLDDRVCRGQIRLSIPIAGGLTMSSLYKYFETHKAALGIQYYSVSPTSLEEVFLRIVGKRDYEEKA